MTKQKAILTIIILLLASGNVFGAFKYLELSKELKEARIILEQRVFNKEVLDFTGLFIEKVIKSEEEVDFETRLQLENAVRNLKDNEILTQWQKFTNSQTEEEAQNEVENLLKLLINKIRI